MATEDKERPALPYTPTNELERLLDSGTEVFTETFVVPLLSATLHVLGTSTIKDDGGKKLTLRVSKAGDGEALVYAFTSASALAHYLKQTERGEDDSIEMTGEALFEAVGATHDILFNLGHKLSPFFPKGVLTPAPIEEIPPELSAT